MLPNWDKGGKTKASGTSLELAACVTNGGGKKFRPQKGDGGDESSVSSKKMRAVSTIQKKLKQPAHLRRPRPKREGGVTVKGRRHCNKQIIQEKKATLISARRTQK